MNDQLETIIIVHVHVEQEPVYKNMLFKTSLNQSIFRLYINLTENKSALWPVLSIGQDLTFTLFSTQPASYEWVHSTLCLKPYYCYENIQKPKIQSTLNTENGQN